MQTEATLAQADVSDLDLVTRCQAGDTEAFDQLVTRYRTRVFGMIYNMVHSEQDAWDLAQDSFLKAWKALNRFPCFEEAVLSKVPCVLLAMNHVVNHAKYSCSVASYQLVECLGVTSLASCHQVQVRHIGLSQSRFRLHELDGSGPCFIQPRKLSGPNRRRHSPRYSPIRVTMPSRT